jgi:hypothetical protein
MPECIGNCRDDGFVDDSCPEYTQGSGGHVFMEATVDDLSQRFITDSMLQ